MPPLHIAALAVGLAALIGLGLGLPDSWFCGLASLTCLLAAAGEAYLERKPFAIAFLAVAAVFAVLAAAAVLRDGHTGRGGTS
ncbi:hypothetical protein [Streptomyces blattellae]|uniref:hypothetical protein n=1 Tax=Streptomyces blattellae TaxID=2569855 RepID=UPI0012B99468|nr:hypothetical protein [Streptomyces blattellae]